MSNRARKSDSTGEPREQTRVPCSFERDLPVLHDVSLGVPSSRSSRPGETRRLGRRSFLRAGHDELRRAAARIAFVWRGQQPCGSGSYPCQARRRARVGCCSCCEEHSGIDAVSCRGAPRGVLGARLRGFSAPETLLVEERPPSGLLQRLTAAPKSDPARSPSWPAHEIDSITPVEPMSTNLRSEAGLRRAVLASAQDEAACRGRRRGREGARASVPLAPTDTYAGAGCAR